MPYLIDFLCPVRVVLDTIRLNCNINPFIGLRSKSKNLLLVAPLEIDMSLRKTHFIIALVASTFALAAYAGPLSIGGFTQVKTEYQYTDYDEYGYPDPLLYEYPEEYFQPLPYVADFPENRGLIRLTKGLGINDEMEVKYQYSDLDEGNQQELFNLKYSRNLSGSADAHLSSQLTTGAAGFLGKMFEAGGKYDWAGFVLASASYAYYSNETDTSLNDSHSWQLKLRQTLTKTTAFQVRHDWFFASGENADFTSNTLTFWLSQWFPTRTALHLEWREHWDTMGLVSHAPTIEIDQYLSWATLVKVRGRYYYGKPSDPIALESIKGDSFNSYSISGIISHYLFAETNVSLKYRYYTSDQDISMNTYLLAIEHIL